MTSPGHGGWSSQPALVPVEHSGGRVRIGDAPVRIGREPSCDVLLADLTVSRRHARIGWDGADLVVEDLDSSGGTFVNGERVSRAVLRPGDVIRLGPRVEYRLEAEMPTTTLILAARQKGDDEEGVRHLQVLLDVARALNAATVVDEVLETVLQAAVKLLAADRAYCLVRDGGAGRATVVSYPRGEPETTWVKLAPHEYGFYANVNPQVDHPRWSQAKERRIGESGWRETLLFNGYADQVADLYAGMDLRTYF